MPDSNETPPPIPATADPGGSGLPPDLAAGIAMIFLLVGGIAFLLLERKSAYVRFYAMQAVIFGLAAIVAGVAFRIADFIFLLIPIVGHLILLLVFLVELVFWLGWLVCYLVAVVKAFTGREWDIPYVGPIARRQLAKAPL